MAPTGEQVRRHQELRGGAARRGGYAVDTGDESVTHACKPSSRTNLDANNANAYANAIANADTNANANTQRCKQRANVHLHLLVALALCAVNNQLAQGGAVTVLPISALDGSNVDDLVRVVAFYL